MKKYVCIRDDDTKYFTAVQELQEGYGEFWGNIPITLATVPFDHGSSRKIQEVEQQINKYRAVRDWELKASADELTEYHKVYPVGENKELVKELKRLIKDSKIEVAQHGVFHRYNEFGPELYSDEISFAAIRDGKEYLEKVFEIEISTFIPPSNTIDYKTIRYVKDLNMHLFVSGSIAYKSKREMIEGYISDPKAIMDKIKQILTGKPVPIMRRAGIYKMGSYTYDTFKNQADMYEKIEKSLEQTGFAAVGTHYILLSNPEYRKRWQELLRKIASIDNVEFVTAKTYYKLLMEKYYE